MEIKEERFNCPNCGAFSHHDWNQQVFGYGNGSEYTNFWISKCVSCGEFCIFLGGYPNSAIQVFPSNSPDIPKPNNDLSEEIKTIYKEAASVHGTSPRSSSALLRLCLQKLMKQLGEKGNNIASDLKSISDKGVLPIAVLRAMDITRFVGNESVHPGIINIDEETGLAKKLFSLLNLIADYGITKPKEVEDLHKIVPENKRQVG